MLGVLKTILWSPFKKKKKKPHEAGITAIYRRQMETQTDKAGLYTPSWSQQDHPGLCPHGVRTCVIPDVAGFEAQGSAAQCETIGPLPAPSTSCFQKFLGIIIPGLK